MVQESVLEEEALTSQVRRSEGCRLRQQGLEGAKLTTTPVFDKTLCRVCVALKVLDC